MGLALGVRKNRKIRIGDHILRVRAIHGFDNIHVDIDGQTYEITDKRATEVVPGVMISAGASPNGQQYQAKLVIDAPRDILIQRLRDE